jgi:hypothetical protein
VLQFGLHFFYLLNFRIFLGMFLAAKPFTVDEVAFSLQEGLAAGAERALVGIG